MLEHQRHRLALGRNCLLLGCQLAPSRAPGVQQGFPAEMLAPLHQPGTFQPGFPVIVKNMLDAL